MSTPETKPISRRLTIEKNENEEKKKFEKKKEKEEKIKEKGTPNMLLHIYENF